MNWLYLFKVVSQYPDPVEEISFLAASILNGAELVYLLLSNRENPAMASAARGDGVFLRTRPEPDNLRLNGRAVVAASPSQFSVTPEVVRPLYGDLRDRWFVPLRGVALFPDQPFPVSVLTSGEQTAFAEGQAFVKQIPRSEPVRKAAMDLRAEVREPASADTAFENLAEVRAHGSRMVLSNHDVPEGDSSSAETIRIPALDLPAPVTSVGLDPTAGTWDSMMMAGPKTMPSVSLVLAPDGTIRPHERFVKRHSTNASFWDEAIYVGARIVTIDGPCDTNGLRVRQDWSDWDGSVLGGIRDAERALSREGVGLFWTTHATVTRFDGASRWIARSLRLFEEGPARLGRVPLIETHPHGVFTFLGRALGKSRGLAPKSSEEGRRARLDLLRAFVPELPVEALPDHDAVDAAISALVGVLHLCEWTTPFGSPGAGGQIWMPRLARR